MLKYLFWYVSELEGHVSVDITLAHASPEATGLLLLLWVWLCQVFLNGFVVISFYFSFFVSLSSSALLFPLLPCSLCFGREELLLSEPVGSLLGSPCNIRRLNIRELIFGICSTLRGLHGVPASRPHGLQGKRSDRAVRR